MYFDIPSQNLLFIIGLLGIFLFFSIKAFKQVLIKKTFSLETVQQMIISLTSIVLFSKYLHHTFGDFLSIIVIPIFIVSLIIYITKKSNKDLKTLVASILYIALLLPILGIPFPITPRKYIPAKSSNRYGKTTSIPIQFPYKFESKTAENYNEKALKLHLNEKYKEAIQLYKKAIKLEPKSPELYFNLSYSYSKINQLEIAVEELNKAISLDSTISQVYNNRGLLYFKMNRNDEAVKDFKMTIALDHSNATAFANLALIYNERKEYEKACNAIHRAEKLGLDISDDAIITKIKDRNCE